MNLMIGSSLFALALLVGMMILLNVGRRIGARHLASDPKGARTGTGTIEAGGRDRKWLHVIGFALVIALTVYVILDIEFPRFGLIRVDAFDQALVDLLKSMK